MANLQVEFKGNGIIKIKSKRYNFDCYSIPRDSISTSIEMDTQMAVYFLIDTFEGRREKRKLFIGKTSTGMRRFFNHKKNKNWWNRLLFFTANDEVFDEDTILGLENLMITKFKDSGLYIMDQEGSNRGIDDDCRFFGDQIIGIVDFLGYPLELKESNDEDDVADVPQNINDKKTEDASKIFNSLDKMIRGLSPNITSDQLKLYTSYKLNNKSICAVWLHTYGLEIELYIRLDKIKDINTGAYDVSLRKRGKRESAIKVTQKSELENAMKIIKQIVEELS